MHPLLTTRGLSSASARSPKLTIGLWVLAVVLSGVVVSTMLTDALTTRTDFTGRPESKRAHLLLKAGFAKGTGPAEPEETVLVQSLSKTVEDPEFNQYVRVLYTAFEALGPDVFAGGSNYLDGARGLVSADRRTTIMPLLLKRPAKSIDAVQDVIAAHPNSDFVVYTLGKGSIDKEFNALAEKDLSAEFRVGLPAALIVLVLVFASLVAAVIPIIAAFISIVIALAITALIGQVFHFSFFVTNMIVMMGLAVGIDYSLFTMSRYREERRRGLGKHEAIAAAGGTASQAVFFSGMTVVLALLGMLIVPTTIFRSLGAGAIIVVFVAVAAALTFLPAVISLLGDGIDALRLPFLAKRVGGPEQLGGFWDRISRGVMARPWVSLLGTSALLVAAAIPALGMVTGQAGVTSFPASAQSRKAFDIMEREFALGLVAKADIVIRGRMAAPEIQAGIERLRSSLAADPAFFATRAALRVNAAGDLAWLAVPMAGDAGMAAPQEAVRRLRAEVIPAAFMGVAAEALVTGGVAGNIDFLDITDRYTPIVFVFVLTLSFILLTLVFRSLIVPIKAIILNLLSVGTAYGLMVLVFIHGVGASLLGFSPVDAIEAWIPLFLFSILFGLSMDYHVFMLSRIRERFDKTGDNDEAVAFGLRTTAGIISGAALIMVAIFAGFASGELVMFQQVGFGLGVSILLDATIVRSILVPASMKLLGTRNWYLPRALAWLPKVRAEGEAYVEAEAMRR